MELVPIRQKPEKIVDILTGNGEGISLSIIVPEVRFLEIKQEFGPGKIIVLD